MYRPRADLQNPQNLELHCQSLEMQLKLLQAEKDLYAKQLKEKEKSISGILSQLSILKKRIHHHKATWTQIAEDNKLLKEQLRHKSGARKGQNALRVQLNSLLSKFYRGTMSPQHAFIMNLLTQEKFYECLQELVVVFSTLFEESTEKSFSYVTSPKVQPSYSIEQTFSPIYRKNSSEDDEEIDRLMDESKMLLKTLELQNYKLDSLNEKIIKQGGKVY